MAKRKPARATGRKTASKRAGASRLRSRAARSARKKGAARKSVARRPRAAARKGSARKVVRKSIARKGAVKKVVRKGRARQGAARKVARKSIARQPVARTVARKTVQETTRKATVRKATARQSPARGAHSGTLSAKPATWASTSARRAPALDRERRVVRDDDIVPSPPSSLDLDRSASAARTGHREMVERLHHHTETSPAFTGGDVDADWEGAYATGDEAPGGDNPTPGQDIVDEIGKALGVQYEDNEELKGEKKISDRDKKRWELDPASAEDYEDR